ncbi:MAG: hypothetical protein ACYS8Y_11895 [Planctomycetota bacterium]
MPRLASILISSISDRFKTIAQFKKANIVPEALLREYLNITIYGKKDYDKEAYPGIYGKIAGGLNLPAK